MDINITKFFNEAAPMDYSASVAEIGANAGPDTWRAANEDASDYNLLDTPEKLQALRDHVRGFGAWSDEEIAAWSDTECNALFIQMISGDMRDFCGDVWNWDEYETGCEEGLYSGNLGRGIVAGEVFYSLEG